MTKFGISAFWECESEGPQSCDEPSIPTTIANQTTQGRNLRFFPSLVGRTSDHICAHRNSTQWHKSFLVKMLCIDTELVCYGCHHKVHKLDGLNNSNLTVLEARSQDQGVDRWLFSAGW